MFNDDEICCHHPDDCRPDHGRDVWPRILHSSMLIRRRAGSARYMNALHEMCGRNAWVLFYLNKQEKAGRAIYQKDIEQSLSMTRSGVSKLIKNMEDNNIIERRAVEGDARLKQIILTDGGRQLSELAAHEKENMEADICAGFSDEELEQFVSYLDRLIANISACGYSGKGGENRNGCD